jgi:heterodisulfide reductase subunit A-like polyferredoxin
MNGRCQGFYCGAHVKALAENKGIEPLQITTTTSRRTCNEPPTDEHVAVAIVGGGPAGLTAAAELAPGVDGEVRQSPGSVDTSR